MCIVWSYSVFSHHVQAGNMSYNNVWVHIKQYFYILTVNPHFLWPKLTLCFTEKNSPLTISTGCYFTKTVRGITVLCHFRKSNLMPVIICKNDKHLITIYTVIFSNITGILSHLSDTWRRESSLDGDQLNCFCVGIFHESTDESAGWMKYPYRKQWP